MAARRRLILGFLLLAALLGGGLAFALWPRATAITRENFKKLKGGMTLAQVEALFGGPARDELGLGTDEGWYESGVDYGVGHHSALIKPERTLIWRSKEFKASLVFSADGKLGVGYGQDMIRIESVTWWDEAWWRVKGWFGVQPAMPPPAPPSVSFGTASSK